jgi:hypothetical protein
VVLDLSQRGSLVWESLEEVVLDLAEQAAVVLTGRQLDAATQHVDEDADGILDVGDRNVAAGRKVAETNIVLASKGT